MLKRHRCDSGTITHITHIFIIVHTHRGDRDRERHGQRERHREKEICYRGKLYTMVSNQGISVYWRTNVKDNTRIYAIILWAISSPILNT